MGIKTKIEYCDSSVNPIMGCTGCALRKKHCYAAAMCAHYAGRQGWPKSFNEPEFFPGRLEKAVGWKDLTGKPRADKPWLDGLPRHIFVNDMSDGFCPDVDAWGWLLPHLDAMEGSAHIWLLLTKWPSRMREFFVSIGGAPDNIHLGVSAENQQAADKRIPILLQTPAAVRFVSCEPLLQEVNLSQFLTPFYWIDSTRAAERRQARPALSWVVCGGESGPGARPMHPEWARGIRDQCQAAGTDFFFKQWGAWYPNAAEHPGFAEMKTDARHIILDGMAFARVGKKRAGRLLDGREWNEMPGPNAKH